MYKVKIITIARKIYEGVDEYEKRLKGKVILDWGLAKTEKQLIEWSLKEPFLILLDPAGTLLSSEKFSEKLVDLFTKHNSRLTFVIGGAPGIPAEIKKQSHFSWSLSPLTFTHQMTQLILVEQIYRALEIDRGSAYHKGES